jgi:hypothetical protein
MEKFMTPERYSVYARTLTFLFNAGDVLLIHPAYITASVGM